MKTIKQLLVIFGIAVMASAATAQTTNIILQTDFEGDEGEGNFNNDYGYCVAGSSAGSVLAGYNGGVLDGIGVDGGYANGISPDYTLLPSDPNWTSPSLSYVYAVVGNGTQFGSPMTAITPTAFLDSFILSADVQVLGLQPGLTNADVSITKVQFFDSSNNIIFDFTGDAGYIGTNFVHISIPLSSLTYGGINGPSQGPDATHPVTDFTNAAVVASISSFTIEFAVNSLPVGVIGGTGTNLISPPFGFTDTGALIVDNIELIQGNPIPPRQQWKNSSGRLILIPHSPTAAVSAYIIAMAPTVPAELWLPNLSGGVGGSNSLEYTVDLSSWSSSPPNSYSGFGVGATEDPLPYTLYDTNRAAYRVYLSAKIGGASAGVTNVPGVMDLHVPCSTWHSYAIQCSRDHRI